MFITVPISEHQGKIQNRKHKIVGKNHPGKRPRETFTDCRPIR